MAQSWTTEQELTFIKNLGTYREGHEITPIRLQLLERYVQTARERFHWGKVDSKQVIEFAEEQLANERLKTSRILVSPSVTPSKQRLS